jgi:hypothetical protein
MSPFAFLLILKTYFDPTMFMDGEKGTRDHVPFLRRASNSVFIDVRHS